MGFNVNTLVFGSAEENITACKGNGIVKKAVEKVFELPIKNR